MFGKDRLPILVFVLVAVFAIGSIFYLYTNEKSQKITLQQQLDEVSRRETAVRAELKKAKSEVDGITKELEDVRIQLASANQELATANLTRQQVMNSLDELRSELEKQVYQKMDLEKELTAARQEAESLQAQLKDMEGLKTDLEAKLKELETVGTSKVELGKIVVNPAAGTTQTSAPVVTAPVAPTVKAPSSVPASTTSTNFGVKSQGASVSKPQTLTGSVLVVNKEYSFAVVNLGARDGLAISDVLAVFEKNKYIGDVAVEKLQDAMSAVNFVTPKMREKLVVGKEYNFKTK